MEATTRIKRIGVLAVLVVGGYQLFLRTQLINDARVDLGGAEMNVVYGIQKILLGRPLYEDPENPPFDVMQYTPAYYGLCAGIGKVLSIDPHDTRGLFQLSRIVSLVFNLITCLLIFRLCRTLGGDKWLAAAVAIVTFTLYTEHFYSRIDSLYAMLFVGALITYVRWLKQPDQRRPLVIAALLAVLCISAKQTGVLVVGMLGVHLLISRQWRGLITYAAAVVVFTGLAAILVFKNTDPGIFISNTVRGIANGMTRKMYIELFHPPIYKYYFAFHLGGLLLIIRAIRKGDAIDRFLAIAIAVAFAFGFLTGLKHGSNINYLFEAHMLVLVAAVRWMSLHAIGMLRPAMGIAVPLAFMVVFGAHRTRVLQLRVGGEQDHYRTELAYRTDLQVRDVLVNELGLRPEDRVFITYRGHLELLLNGQGLIAQKDIIEWSQAPLYDYSTFTRMMDDGSVRFVIADHKLDTLRFLGRSWAPLRPVTQVNRRFVYGLPNAR